MTFFTAEPPRLVRGRIPHYITQYNGRTYKSRTEAKWAVFMDALNIKFWYEPRKFDFGVYRYIPDFYLPELKIWIEVKGKYPSAEQVAKVKAVAEVTGENAFLFFAWADTPNRGKGAHAIGYDWRNGLLFGDDMYTWTQCGMCRTFDIALLGRSDLMRCGCLKSWGKRYGDEATEIMNAFAKARDFE